MLDKDNSLGINELMATAIHALTQSRSPIDRLEAPSASGIYTIYLSGLGTLQPFKGGPNGLIYIGLSTDLTEREFEQHFASGNSGFSTLRRSIGALMKAELDLRAIPRSDGPSETNVRNYRFTDDGEVRLTMWMRDYLEVGVYASARYKELEDVLVSTLKPVLNLTKWQNPERKEIKRLRKVCADEARTARGS